MKLTLTFPDGTVVNFGDGRTDADRDALILMTQKGLTRGPVYAEAYDPESGAVIRGEGSLQVKVTDEEVEAGFVFGEYKESWETRDPTDGE